MPATNGSAALSTATPTSRRDILHDNTFHCSQIFHCIDVGKTKVIAPADISHHCDMATVETQSFAQKSASCRLKHRGIDIGMKKNFSCALWAAAIAGIDALDPPYKHHQYSSCRHATPDNSGYWR